MIETLTKREARLLYRIDLRDIGMWKLSTPLEMIAAQALVAKLNPRPPVSLGSSYHAGGDFLTVLYHPCEIVLVQNNEPLEGIYIGKNHDMEILKSGLELRAFERKNSLLKTHRRKKIDSFVCLEDVMNLPKIISALKVRGLTEAEVLKIIEGFYSEEGREYRYHRHTALTHLGISYEK